MSPTPTKELTVTSENLGICRVEDITDAAIAEASRLLQKNHDEIHMFWRDANGHNHTAHNLLTSLALGANPEQLQQAYEDDERDQARALPTPNQEVVEALNDPDVFYEKLGQGCHYSDYMTYFEKKIKAEGVEAVVVEHLCSRTRNAEALFARLFEGAFHSIIHLGFGLEFQLPGIVAEGLAQAATDGSFGMEAFFRETEQHVEEWEPKVASKPLPKLLHELHDNEKTRRGALWDDVGVSKITAGVIGRARQEMIHLASQFRVEPSELEQKLAEMISSVAYMAGAGQRQGKPRKIDFFLMHDVTSSIFLTVLARQEFIPLADRCRLVEFKGRMDLVWYAACGAPQLNIDNIDHYEPEKSRDWSWEELFSAINIMHDDGHVGKFARALKHGEDMSAGVSDDVLPVKRGSWLKLAQMAYDTNYDLPGDKKWIFFAGFDKPWEAL